MQAHDPRLRYNDARHEYSIDGQRLPSVSQIIQPICGMERIPQNRLDAARMRGTYVHQCIEWLIDGSLDRGSVDPALAGYVSAFEAWNRVTRHDVVSLECMTSNLPLWYAGRVDMLTMIDGDLWLIDYKTSSKTSRHYGCQLAGYRMALASNGIEVKRSGCLYLSADGSWSLIEYPEAIYQQTFLACLTMRAWSNWNE